jgi:hypothetical protein
MPTNLYLPNIFSPAPIKGLRIICPENRGGLVKNSYLWANQLTILILQIQSLMATNPGSFLGIPSIGALQAGFLRLADELAIFHDKVYLPNGFDVIEGIGRHGDYIGGEVGCD